MLPWTLTSSSVIAQFVVNFKVQQQLYFAFNWVIWPIFWSKLWHLYKIYGTTTTLESYSWFYVTAQNVIFLIAFK